MGGSGKRWIDTYESVGGTSQKSPNNLPKCQEIRVRDFNKTKATRGIAGGTLANNSLSRYQNADLESAAYELLDIWAQVRSYSSFFKAVAQAINDPDSIASESMARGHVRRYWATESDRTTKNCLIAIRS